MRCGMMKQPKELYFAWPLKLTCDYLFNVSLLFDESVHACLLCVLHDQVHAVTS